jgi:hypothetical protein
MISRWNHGMNLSVGIFSRLSVMPAMKWARMVGVRTVFVAMVVEVFAVF